MRQEPFIYLYSRDGVRETLGVPPGYEGFVVYEGGRLNLPPGMHRFACKSVLAVFLVRVGGSHTLDLASASGAMLHAADGRWRPLKVLGRLAYSVAKPELLVDLFVRERISEPRRLDRELSTLVVELLSRVLDGETWSAEKLTENLDLVSGELLRRLTVTMAPLGLTLQGLQLDAAPTPPLEAGVQAYPV